MTTIAFPVRSTFLRFCAFFRHVKMNSPFSYKYYIGMACGQSLGPVVASTQMFGASMSRITLSSSSILSFLQAVRTAVASAWSGG